MGKSSSIKPAALLSDGELARQYRVLKQTLSMHTQLRDEYSCKSLLLDLSLLAISTVLCGTTFASKEVFPLLGLPESYSSLILGLASVLAFFLSIAEMRIGWKGSAARHGEAIPKLNRVIAEFRGARDQNGKWPKNKWDELNHQYWNVMDGIVEIPFAKFNYLKADYLRKVAVSKMLDCAPGCPVWLLNLRVRWNALGASFSNGGKAINSPERDKQSG